MKLRALTFIPALLLGAFPILGAPNVACAGEGPSAALVVHTGSAVTRYCVSLDASSVSGIRLIELASEQHGVPYSLGFGGKAVCMLEDVGPTSDDCFEEYPNYWGYWRGDGSGGWTWSSSGAGSTSVSDGDVEGWAWGSGQNASTHPAPPATTFGSVCGERSESDASEPQPSGSKADRSPSKAGSAPQASSEEVSAPEGDEAAAAAGGDTKKKRRSTDRRSPREGEPEAVPAADQSPVELATHPTASPGDEGPPPAGLVALGASLLLAGSAAFLVRRKRS